MKNDHVMYLSICGSWHGISRDFFHSLDDAVCVDTVELGHSEVPHYLTLRAYSLTKSSMSNLI